LEKRRQYLRNIYLESMEDETKYIQEMAIKKKEKYAKTIEKEKFMFQNLKMI